MRSECHYNEHSSQHKLSISPHYNHEGLRLAHWFMSSAANHLMGCHLSRVGVTPNAFNCSRKCHSFFFLHILDFRSVFNHITDILWKYWSTIHHIYSLMSQTHTYTWSCTHTRTYTRAHIHMHKHTFRFLPLHRNKTAIFKDFPIFSFPSTFLLFFAMYVFQIMQS